MTSYDYFYKGYGFYNLEKYLSDFNNVNNTLKNSKIYRTDLDGSIEIKLNKNGYKIRTCPP